ncbi:MAG: glutamate--tRNA ligase family protein [Thioalkalivibrionaceae bacterium]
MTLRTPLLGCGDRPVPRGISENESVDSASGQPQGLPNHRTEPTPALLRPVVGRFAPTPSGHLHAGSVFSALMSWLDARAWGGEWFLRIDDLDAPRVLPGAEHHIIAELARIGLEPDRAIARQQGRQTRYREITEALAQSGHLFACRCSRRNLAAATLRFADGPIYPGTCKPAPIPRSASSRSPHHSGNRPAQTRATVDPHALRLALETQPLTIHDVVLGEIWANPSLLGGDFIVQRRDGQANSLLAGLIDDLDSGVNRWVRGIDLLTFSLRQHRLIDHLKTVGLHNGPRQTSHPTSPEHPTPNDSPGNGPGIVPGALRHGHIHIASWHHPLARAIDGKKLSKSRSAPPTHDRPAPQLLAQALSALPALPGDDDLRGLIQTARRAQHDDRGLNQALLDEALRVTGPFIRNATLRWADDTHLLDRR